MAGKQGEPRNVRRALASGPKKKPPKGPPVPELSSHKTRARWFQARESWPMRESPIQTLIRERTRVRAEARAASGTAQWEFVGPSNIGGRMTAIVCHPQQTDRIWVGSAGGGVWRSTDAGQTWESLWHNQPTLNVGSLAMDPTDPNIIYCGTGEANGSADSHAGVGLFHTQDGGTTWQELANAQTLQLPNRIGVIAIDPFNRDHILIGGVAHRGYPIAGMFTSTDRGQTWQRATLIGQVNYWCQSIVFHPTTSGTIFSTVSRHGANNGIWRTTDGGNSWTHLISGLPFSSAITRTSLAISPSDPTIMYAISANNQGGVLGVFRSSDGGDTWSNVGGQHFGNERQMRYNNTIAIHPTNPNHVICAGVDLHRTTNGGQTWTRITRWDFDRGHNQYAHADHHALLMPPALPGRVYDMNDGGMDLSENGGTTWSNRSHGLGVTMYYDLEIAQSNSQMYGGGTQDNGTNITDSGSADDHFQILGGDGGWMVIDPTQENHLYASVYNMIMYRFRPSDGWTKVTPSQASVQERERMWMVYIVMDPNDQNIVFTGTHRVWRTLDDADNWAPVSNTLDGSRITAIEVARADSNRLYVGTEHGGIFRSMDGGDSWSQNLANAILPGRTITRIKTRPDDADSVYVTVANFGHRHVFHSHDGGVNWADIDQGQLPDVPHHGIAIPVAHPNRVFVCNDAGAFVSLDSGTTWLNLSRNLPNVMVIDLVYHQQDETLFAATYGRSIWRIDATFGGGNPTILSPADGSTLSSSTVTFEWTADGASVTDWSLLVGSSQGASDHFNSGSLGTSLSQPVTGLPTDGSQIFVQLRFKIGGVWQFADFTYLASTSGSPTITTPVTNSTLSGSSATFEWTANGAAVTEWWLYVGSGAGTADHFNSGSLGTGLFRTVTGLPVDGSQLFVRLWFNVAGAWKHDDFIYTAATAGTPTIISPLPGSTLTGSTATFEWTANGAAVTGWWLYMGSSEGAFDYFNSGWLGTSLSRTVSGLPTDGSQLFVRLWFLVGGGWQSADFTFTTS